MVKTITIPLRLVLESISESEISGNSALVSPVTNRRRPQHHRALPQHPHRRRKVSAPPELQPHLGSPVPHHAHPHHSQGHQQGAGGAIPDFDKPEYILSLNPNTLANTTGFYSGSDSGVPSEYSSWTAPVSRIGTGAFQHRRDTPESNLSPSVSVDDLATQRQNDRQNHNNVAFYQSDSDCESLVDDISSPRGHRKSSNISQISNLVGMNNPAYVHTESPNPVVLPVSSPPPLVRVPTEPQITPTPSIVGIPPAQQPRRHSHSMVLQLNLQGSGAPNTGLTTAGPSNGRSVSMVSLTGPPQNQIYPNLNDTQSIYSDVGFSQPSPGVVKVVESQGNLNSESPANHSPTEELEAPQPTEESEKQSWFLNTLSSNLSIIYAVFLVSLGLVIYLADTFSGHDSAMAEGFNVFLIIIQLLWLLSVHIDVRRYVSLISRALDEAKTRQENKDDQVQLESTGDGQYQLRFSVPEAPRTIPQHYGFTSGRHGGSLYLKIGALVFCLGHLIHTGLNLGQKILYLSEDDPQFVDCTCTTDVIMSVLMPVYAFYQLFFTFKYSNLIINRRQALSKFGIMHCIGASLCFWVYTILQETLQAIFMKKKDYHKYESDAYVSTTMSALIDDDSEEMDEPEMAHYSGRKLAAASSSAWSINYGCEKDTDLSNMINTTTPYLYPFSIEFNILMVGFWILLWENIGRFDRHTHIPSVEVTYEEDNSRSLTSNMIIYVDCHSSNRGLFAGLLMTVATVISIILFFIFSASEDDLTRQLGLYVNSVSEIILLGCMLIAAFISYNSLRHLDVIQHEISSVDDILLFVCLPCIFLYAFLSMVPSINDGNYLSVSVSVLQVSQVILQTSLICDGLRRCSNAQSLQHKKPGREVVTYLVVTNVAMWLLQTFEIKSSEGNHANYDFYGKELWTMLSHLTLPLALFYRFHSSVCLADMWKASYEAEEH